jgi:hypothetical protein
MPLRFWWGLLWICKLLLVIQPFFFANPWTRRQRGGIFLLSMCHL